MIKNYLEILKYCQKFSLETFGFGFRPDFYSKFDWVQDDRLEAYIKRHDREIGLVRLGNDVSLHRDKDVSINAKLIVFKDFDFEINGQRSTLKAGELIEFKGTDLHRGWNCCCLIMWNRKKSR
ncbi:MAG: hypothetical protein IM560_18945 [Pseudanabaena sp. M085S1SP2A07QC]|jgi:hypothetical protein|nr:hypothetical protein [Pseudanabaena sp. M090S1SP2A07QC]MCA6508766.1 hypothetical protein [Pseudanabaena sp. M109S1SP2A07QC]MCA6579461.1 hypothetical protein [Pseudanabaena sp. M085S1SP2A07QC]